MNAIAANTKSAEYISAVEKNLQHLDLVDRAELIDELRTHVALLISEDPNTDLIADLGSPENYAQQLLEAADQELTARKESFLGRPIRKILITVVASSIMTIGIAGAFGFNPSPHAEEFPVKDRYYKTPNIVGMDSAAAIRMLSVNRDNIPICNLPELLNRDLSKSKVIDQAPVVGEVINPAMQCISITISK